MSTVSGLNAKAEKGKQKYVALDINSIYKGKSLDNPKATVQPKHGLQSLGKVGAGRRMPPPANLPSLKSENSGNNPNISLVPSGGQGWGSATKEKGKTEENSGNQQQSPQLQPASSHSQTTQKTQATTPNATVAPGGSKTWSSVTSNQEDGGQERSFLAQQSPFFPQEFPKLAGGDAQTEGNQKSSADSQYGPGPSLRPQTEGSWGRGTLQQQQILPGPTGGQQLSSGSGVNGQQPPGEPQSLPSSQQHARERSFSSTPRGGPLPPSSAGSGNSVSATSGTPVLGPCPPGPNPSMGGTMGPSSALHPPPPQFTRGMMQHPYMYGRNSYPSGYQSSYSGLPSAPPPPTRQTYPYPENRRPQPVRPLAEEEAYQRPAAIITEKALKGFDEILQNDTQDTWATSHGEIDYNAKLVFSDDEETPVTQKDKRDDDEKTRSHEGNKREKDRERDRDQSMGERDERNRESEWARDNRSDKKLDRESEWCNERREAFDRDRDDRWKGWAPQPQGRPPQSLSMEIPRQWQPSQPQQRMPFDYRGPPPPPQPPGTYAPPHVRIGPGPPPIPQHPCYPPPPPRPSRSGQRPPSITDDEEMWRQRRKQHSDEMNMAVERARQRRAEDEKHYEQSKQSAQEKAKAFEKTDKEIKDDVDEHERSRHSSGSREDKPPSRDGRDRDRSQTNFQGFGFSRQFQKHVPPRFQKQAELRQQQTQQPALQTAAAISPSPSTQQAQHFLRQSQQPQSIGPGAPPPNHPISSGTSSHGSSSQASLPMGVNFDPRCGTHVNPPYNNQVTGMPVPKSMSRPRSNSQGSGTDSYESDRCTPDQTVLYDRDSRDHYWNRDRRQAIPPSGYESWRGTGESEEYYDNCEAGSQSYEQRMEFKHAEKEDKNFDSRGHEIDRRDREFENQDCRYKGRDGSFKERETKLVEPVREVKDRDPKSNSWSNSRYYEERMQDSFDKSPEIKSNKDRHERWDRERHQRPDSRDSRASRESLKEERHLAERHETQSSHSSQIERVRKGVREDKDKLLNWGDTPYNPTETKSPPKRDWHHYPPPITAKQFESVAPPKKNLTTLRRNTTMPVTQNTTEHKAEVPKDDNKKSDIELNLKKEKDAKEEKNEKIRCESTLKESEKCVEKVDHSIEKLKSSSKESNRDGECESTTEAHKKDTITTTDEKEKCMSREGKDKSEHVQARTDQTRDRRRDGRDRTNGNSRTKGTSGVSVINAGVGGSGNNRFESSRGGRGTRGSTGGFGGSSGGFRGRSREYRRSRVERGPRFDRQKERDKDKGDKKEKNTDDSSFSETEEGKLGHLRQKDEDSEVSVDEASASTTESAQAEKYQSMDGCQDDKNLIVGQLSVHKEDFCRSEKHKDKKDNCRKENKSFDSEKIKDDKGGFAPRGEPSRRGRGGGGGTVSFRNSRGGLRYGPSNYGPPPSTAAFGSRKLEKPEQQKSEDVCKDAISGDYQSNIQQPDSTNNLFNRDVNKSQSLERSQQRRQSRFEHLPPRLQKRQARRYDNYDPLRGRGRSYNYQGNNSQMSNKMNQGAKENLSDVANEEWETASESSDVAERRDRRDDLNLKDELKKKDFKDKGSVSRKSFSSQRPMNDINQMRRTGTDSRRGNNISERNRQRDGFGRDNRGRDSGRNRMPMTGSFTSGNSAVDRRIMNSSGNNSRPNSAGQSGGLGGRNARSGHSQTKANAFPQKNEGTTTVYRVDEIKLQDPSCVQTAIADISQRKSFKSEVAVGNKNLKTEKEKAGGLEGYDLNNYASVVIIDDHPEVIDESALLCGAEDGFQEVTSKKRHKVALDADIKKIKKEPHSRNKSGSRSRQSRLPPRFAKIRESSQLKPPVGTSSSTTTSWDLTNDITANSKQSSQFPIKDAPPAPPPPVNAWEKPITHSLQLQSTIGQNACAGNISSSVSNSINVTCANSTVVTADLPILATSSKSSSFDRSDQHDSGIDVSDQPASAASSQRSSPSNDCKILTPKNSTSGKVSSSEACTDLVNNIDSCKPMCTVVFENKNYKAENAVLDKFGGQAKNQLNKESTMASDSLTTVGGSLLSKESSDSEETKALKLPVTFSTKDPFGKGEASDMKLDFTFDSELAQLTDEKAVGNSGNGGNATTKAINIGRSVEVSNGSTAVCIQSPISPSADELNLKIASVKKVWENVSPMPTVLEHPQTSIVTEENSCQTSYSSYSGNSDPPNNAYNATVESASQSRKDSVDSSDIAFRENIPLQQNCNSSGLITKTVDPGICSMKSQQVHLPQHNQMPGPHCAGPLSPPLISGLDTTMTGIRTIPGLASSVQVAGIPAIPSPPTVLFNSSQQMAQSGLYQPLQMDNRQNQAAAVAAAMVQFSQSPHGYALGTYGLSHQPSAQLSNAFGQQNLFVQPPSAHQGQDMYSTNQFRVQPPYPQSQHVTSSQVLNAQPNMASSHLLGSQLVQTRTAAGPSATAPHLQGLHGLQPVQPGSQTSYYSSPAQAQTAANFYHQPPATPGSPMQQPQFPSHQGYGSQSALNVLPQPATVTANYRTYGSHQFKTPVTVINNMVPESSAPMRSATRSPTMDSSSSRMFAVGNTKTTTMNSGSVMAVPQISSPGVVGKMGQPQVNASSSARLGSNSNSKTTQYTLPQSQQHYYPFGQQKFGHVQSSAVRPQVVFPNMVRNSPHPNQHVTPAASIHYPPPIQRPGGHTNITQATAHQSAKVGSRSQVSLMVPGGKLTHAEQAKLRAEAVQQTHMFFAQTKTGKHEEMAGVLVPEKSGLPSCSSPKLSSSSSASEEIQDGGILSPVNEPKPTENLETKEGNEVPTIEE